MQPFDIKKAVAELAVLREFIDFVNRQVGVYCDCLSGFQSNKVRTERQVARINHPVSKRIDGKQPIIVWESVEDPTRPDVIHHRIVRADEFVKMNAEAEFNERQVCWAIIVFVFAYWEEEVRPKIARIRGVQSAAIQVDALGDLRLLRHAIVHNGGVLIDAEYAKLKILNAICTPGSMIALDHNRMHQLFIAIKNAIGRIILEYTGNLPGAPKPEELVDIAISDVRAPE